MDSAFLQRSRNRGKGRNRAQVVLISVGQSRSNGVQSHSQLDIVHLF